MHKTTLTLSLFLILLLAVVAIFAQDDKSDDDSNDNDDNYNKLSAEYNNTVDARQTTQPCGGPTVFVSPGFRCGSTACTGSTTRPFPSIAAALTALQSQRQYTLLLRNGVYRELFHNIFNQRVCIRPAPGQNSVSLTCEDLRNGGRGQAFFVGGDSSSASTTTALFMEGFVISGCGNRQQEGGAIIVKNAQLTLKNMLIANNVALNGGGIAQALGARAILFISGTRFSNNKARGLGGALILSGGTFASASITGSSFSGNVDTTAQNIQGQPNNIVCSGQLRGAGRTLVALDTSTANNLRNTVRCRGSCSILFPNTNIPLCSNN